jgi:putative membrane protein
VEAAGPPPAIIVYMTEIRTLVALFWLAVAWSAVRPFDPMDYWLEIATPVLGFLILWVRYKRFTFTRLSYRLLFVEALILIVGAHYTHERVPLFDWLRDAVGGARNDYDRLAHFCVGFLLVIPVREILIRRSPLRGRWLGAMSVVSILAFAAFYEIFEWWVAMLASPTAGAAYLGSQGDVWDAQKDMLLDGVGAIIGVLVWTGAHERELKQT